MSNDPQNQTERSVPTLLWVWFVLGCGVLLLLAWVIRFPWAWF
jgi:hypothetical protein